MLRRAVQGASLLLFVLALLWAASAPEGADFFLRMDPSAMAGSALADRSLLPRLWPAALMLALAVLAGRIFCGFICPLGVTVDLADRAAKGRVGALRPETRRRLRMAKYHVLALILTAAVLGVSLVFLAAPIPLATRFYGLLLLPLLKAAASLGLDAGRPLFFALNWDALSYASLPVPRFATQIFLAAMLAAVLLPALAAPRFWCRYLCPAGALFALFARIPGGGPLIRRRVSEACIHCGACQRRCPMDAIPPDPLHTRYSECIACGACARACPVEAIAFPLLGGASERAAESGAALERRSAPAPAPPSPSRRAFLWTGTAGLSAALLAYTDLASPLAPAGPGAPPEGSTLRPPGALPEPSFLARCVRCGQCMDACPTNTLQPVWLQAGLAGVFTPTLTPTRGPCDPACNVCGRACPTRALRALSLWEKQHAKLGTARIFRRTCLAWEEGRQCLVCDEVCPYDAVELRRTPGIAVPAPFVIEERCAGCGLCEYHCPVRPQRAIQVQASGALRLAQGSYVEASRVQGLDLRLRAAHGEPANESPPGEAPPGFDELAAPVPDTGPPPGFSKPETAPSPAGDGDALPPSFSNPEE